MLNSANDYSMTGTLRAINGEHKKLPHSVRVYAGIHRRWHHTSGTRNDQAHYQTGVWIHQPELVESQISWNFFCDWIPTHPVYFLVDNTKY